MTRMLRWAVIGTGSIATSFARDCRLAEGATLAAICSRDPARAEAFARQHGVAESFGDLDELLARTDIDAVYLATPNTAHAEAAERILRGGKPLLVEKPMTVRAGDAERLAAIAAANETFLMEAMWTRYLPAHGAAKRAIASGAIGAVTGLRAELAFHRPFDPASRFFDPALGGGALFDLGVYTLSMAEFYLGEADAVSGRWTAAATGVDMCADLVFRKGPVEARLSCGFEREGGNLCVIEGTEATIVLAAPFMAAEGYFLVRNGLAKRLLTADTALFRGAAARLPALPGITWHGFPRAGGGLEYEIAAAGAAIFAGQREEPAMPVASTIRTLRWIEAVLAMSPVGTAPD